MKEIKNFPKTVAKNLKAVFMDIDGTLTNDGKLLAESYNALWRLKELGLKVVPVTGRPAGWCDLIVRQWPVDGVIGENGAFAFWLENKKLKRLFHPEVASPNMKPKLDQVKKIILKEIPDSRVAAGYAYSLFDLPIDFREEEPDLGFEVADKIKEIFEKLGATAKVSDIHVNGWFGNYNKLAMVKLFTKHVWHKDLEANKEQYAFCGDSPNDEPMFAYFDNSIAVANISPFIAGLKSLPTYITQSEGGLGFAEFVDIIENYKNS